MSLFEYNESMNNDGPLAYRMRPRSLDEYAGQDHLIGPGAPIRKMIEDDRLHSFVLYGPPGSGKTSLALLIANTTKCHFEYIKAVASGVSDLRKIASDAEQRKAYYQQRTILFVDEVHRFNKSQQDVLLPYVESGLFTLIGATTENPLYEINSALLSRLKIYVLEPLNSKELKGLLDRALNDVERGLSSQHVTVAENAMEQIIIRAKGDARTAFNILESACHIRGRDTENSEISAKDIEETAGQFYINYDKRGDSHYDTISAFIKSVRGSDPDASLFWLAVMIHGGEDPRFIARRLIILAAEDIGLADPRALSIAIAAMQAADFVGFPEARIPLAEATIYLANAPKSNSSITSIDQALNFVRNLPSFQVPSHIADSSHSRSKSLGKGIGYKYPHAFGGYVEQNYFPVGIENPVFYVPSKNGDEGKKK
ncbi:MAG: replication-associated recombination protein A [Ignavibacteriales bacterium]